MAYTLLVIDDDRGVLHTVADLLLAHGYRVLTAGSGHEGIAVARAERPHLVLMDYSMAGMNGTAVVSALKDDARTARIPVVALTAATAHVAAELMRAGCIGYIPKPVEGGELARLVARFLAQTVGRRAVPGAPAPREDPEP